MKIGIIGLKPRQMADMSARKFEHEVICMASVDRRYTTTSVGAFARDKDQVLILQQQVPKHIQDSVPVKKRRILTGSVGTIVNHINNLNAPKEPGVDNLKHWSEVEYAGEDLASTIRAGAPFEAVNEALTLMGIRSITLADYKRIRKNGVSGKVTVRPYSGPSSKTVSAPPVEATPEPEASKSVLTETEKQEVHEEKILSGQVDAGAVAEMLVEHKLDHLFEAPKDSLLPTPDMVGFPLPVSLYSDVPEGLRSQYLLPKHEILVNYPNSGGVMDYRILRAALPGDVLRFARPEGVAFRNWRNRITNMRWNYFRNDNLLIEAHFYQDYVDLKIMSKVEDIVHRENFTMAPEAEAQAETYRDTMNELSDQGRALEKEVAKRITLGRTETVLIEGSGVDCYYFIPHLQPVRDYLNYLKGVLEDGLPAVRFGDINIDTTIHERPQESQRRERKSAPVSPTRAPTVDEQVFWRQVHLALLGQGLSVKEASVGADEALAEQMIRFG